MVPSPRAPRMMCGLANHTFVGEIRYITDRGLLSFVRHMHPSFDEDVPVCLSCYSKIWPVYRKKLRSAMKKRTEKVQSSMEQSSTPTDNSDPNNSSNSSNQQSKTIPLAYRNVLYSSSSTNDSRSNHTVMTAIPRDKRRATVVAHDSSLSSLDMGPTTSAAAAARGQAKRSKRMPPIVAGASSSGDDYDPSPNALNGSRLPHIQPVLRRTQYVQLNKDIMDIYLAGTTGG